MCKERGERTERMEREVEEVREYVESTHLNAAEPQRGGGGGPNVGLCRGCEYCRSVDIDGKVDCDLFYFSGGREKTYCRGYKAKGDKG